MGPPHSPCKDSLVNDLSGWLHQEYDADVLDYSVTIKIRTRTWQQKRIQKHTHSYQVHTEVKETTVVSEAAFIQVNITQFYSLQTCLYE
jgi:hypothetical protein